MSSFRAYSRYEQVHNSSQKDYCPLIHLVTLMATSKKQKINSLQSKIDHQFNKFTKIDIECIPNYSFEVCVETYHESLQGTQNGKKLISPLCQKLNKTNRPQILVEFLQILANQYDIRGDSQSYTKTLFQAYEIGLTLKKKIQKTFKFGIKACELMSTKEFQKNANSVVVALRHEIQSNSRKLLKNLSLASQVYGSKLNSKEDKKQNNKQNKNSFFKKILQRSVSQHQPKLFNMSSSCKDGSRTGFNHLRQKNNSTWNENNEKIPQNQTGQIRAKFLNKSHSKTIYRSVQSDINAKIATKIKSKTQMLPFHMLLYEMYSICTLRINSDLRKKYFKESKNELKDKIIRQYPGRNIEQLLFEIDLEKLKMQDARKENKHVETNLSISSLRKKSKVAESPSKIIKKSPIDKNRNQKYSTQQNQMEFQESTQSFVVDKKSKILGIKTKNNHHLFELQGFNEKDKREKITGLVGSHNVGDKSTKSKQHIRTRVISSKSLLMISKKQIQSPTEEEFIDRNEGECLKTQKQKEPYQIHRIKNDQNKGNILQRLKKGQFNEKANLRKKSKQLIQGKKFFKKFGSGRKQNESVKNDEKQINSECSGQFSVQNLIQLPNKKGLLNFNERDDKQIHKKVQKIEVKQDFHSSFVHKQDIIQQIFNKVQIGSAIKQTKDFVDGSIDLVDSRGLSLIVSEFLKLELGDNVIQQILSQEKTSPVTQNQKVIIDDIQTKEDKELEIQGQIENIQKDEQERGLVSKRGQTQKEEQIECRQPQYRIQIFEVQQNQSEQFFSSIGQSQHRDTSLSSNSQSRNNNLDSNYGCQQVFGNKQDLIDVNEKMKFLQVPSSFEQDEEKQEDNILQRYLDEEEMIEDIENEQVESYLYQLYMTLISEQQAQLNSECKQIYSGFHEQQKKNQLLVQLNSQRHTQQEKSQSESQSSLHSQDLGFEQSQAVINKILEQYLDSINKVSYQSIQHNNLESPEFILDTQKEIQSDARINRQLSINHSETQPKQNDNTPLSDSQIYNDTTSLDNQQQQKVLSNDEDNFDQQLNEIDQNLTLQYNIDQILNIQHNISSALNVTSVQYSETQKLNLAQFSPITNPKKFKCLQQKSEFSILAGQTSDRRYSIQEDLAYMAEFVRNTFIDPRNLLGSDLNLDVKQNINEKIGDKNSSSDKELVPGKQWNSNGDDLRRSKPKSIHIEIIPRVDTIASNLSLNQSQTHETHSIVITNHTLKPQLTVSDYLVTLTVFHPSEKKHFRIEKQFTNPINVKDYMKGLQARIIKSLDKLVNQAMKRETLYSNSGLTITQSLQKYKKQQLQRSVIEDLINPRHQQHFNWDYIVQNIHTVNLQPQLINLKCFKIEFKKAQFLTVSLMHYIDYKRLIVEYKKNPLELRPVEIAISLNESLEQVVTLFNEKNVNVQLSEFNNETKPILQVYNIWCHVQAIAISLKNSTSKIKSFFKLNQFAFRNDQDVTRYNMLIRMAHGDNQKQNLVISDLGLEDRNKLVNNLSVVVGYAVKIEKGKSKFVVNGKDIKNLLKML